MENSERPSKVSIKGMMREVISSVTSPKAEPKAETSKTANDYYTYIKSPDWQRKRLAVMDRDNWTCQNCGSTTAQLNVHHLRYTKVQSDIEICDLITLCEKCHQNVEVTKRTIKVLLDRIYTVNDLNGIFDTVSIKAART